MERPGDLVSFVSEENQYHIYKDGGFQYEIKYVLACQHEKGNTYDSFAANAAIASAITYFTSLFTALIAVDGTSRDSGPSGHGKATCGNDKDA